MLTLTSPDGDQGYPGTLTAHGHVHADQATTSSGWTTTPRPTQPTIVNLTNHSYFNLAGEGSGTIYDHKLYPQRAAATRPVDATLIPTGAIDPVAGTPMDFRQRHRHRRADPRRVPQLVIGRGYDHNWVLDRGRQHTRLAGRRPGSPSRPAAGCSPCRTTEPGIQFYSGNFLDGTLVGTSGRMYRQGDGFALETQHFPDSPNHANFPSTVLRPGQVYRTTTGYQFGTTGH